MHGWDEVWLGFRTDYLSMEKRCGVILKLEIGHLLLQVRSID